MMSSKNTSLQNMLQTIRSPQNNFLVAKVSLFAFVILIATTIIKKTILNQYPGDALIFTDIGAIAFLGVLGLAGLLVVIRQELQQVVVIRGRLAVFYGVLWCAFSWILMIRHIVNLINEIAKFVQ